MVKARTNISIDPALLERARKSKLNISAEVEKLLKSKEIKKSDLPEESIIIKCSLCHKEIEEGFLCPERDLVLCNECQETFDMSHCPHDKRGEHLHIKWPGFENQNLKYVNEAKRISGVKHEA